MPDLPKYYSEDAAAIIASMKADLETRLGRVLSPADIEMLVLQSEAYFRLLGNVKGNEVARQNLVAFASGSALDYLVQLLGVVRLPSSGALSTLQFNMVADNTGLLIPAGTRVQSIDQKYIFTTVEDVTVASGVLTATVTAEATTAGAGGNGYTAGQVNNLLDPLPFVNTVENTDTTAGGTDEETDDQLRARFYLAPSSFSVAGPVGAYKFFAASAHPTIVDVAVMGHADDNTIPPGQVNIYPLCNNGTLPSTEIIDLVEAICSSDKVRPLSDTVVVAAPAKIDYSINLQITKYTGVNDDDILVPVNAALLAFKNEGLNKLGRDVIVQQIKALAVIDGKTYDVAATYPASNIVAAKNEYTNCTGITVTITGSNGG